MLGASFVLHSIIAIAAGALAAASLVVAWRPDAKQVFAKIRPYETAIGVGLFGWGIYMFIFELLTILGSLLAAPLRMGIYATSIVAVAAVGFLLGYPTLARLLARGSNDTAERVYRWLVQSRVAVGVTAAISGLAVLLF